MINCTLGDSPHAVYMEGARDFHLNMEDCIIKKTSDAPFKMEEGGSLDLRRIRYAGRTSPKVRRNDPCTCGSGAKFKHCHGS